MEEKKLRVVMPLHDAVWFRVRKSKLKDDLAAFVKLAQDTWWSILPDAPCHPRGAFEIHQGFVGNIVEKRKF